MAAGVLGQTTLFISPAHDDPKPFAVDRGQPKETFRQCPQKFRGISEAKMLECLARPGRDIDIVVKPARRGVAAGAVDRVNVVFD